ncbi:hypothetical protein DFJ77DRAFT_443713 [Powellomyces hirtus]|nr:hypothetical protein DFJ77DRAFT_443713 [Powellomyces hirtus]
MTSMDGCLSFVLRIRQMPRPAYPIRSLVQNPDTQHSLPGAEICTRTAWCRILIAIKPIALGLVILNSTVSCPESFPELCDIAEETQINKETATSKQTPPLYHTIHITNAKSATSNKQWTRHIVGWQLPTSYTREFPVPATLRHNPRNKRRNAQHTGGRRCQRGRTTNCPVAVPISTFSPRKFFPSWAHTFVRIPGVDGHGHALDFSHNASMGVREGGGKDGKAYTSTSE